MHPEKIHRIIAGFIFAVMLVMYLLTVAPTISFWDCGEFVTCSYIMGIPHPPGSPLLSLIGRVMSLIPFYDFRGDGIGEIAYRVNMLDVIIGALTVTLTYFIMVKLIHKIRPYRGNRLDEAVIMVASAITAFMVGFSDEFWTNAIEIETYMPSLFMQMLAVWLVLRWDERKDEPRAVMLLFLAAYIIGLGNGVHLTVLLIAPSIVLLVMFSKPGWFRESKLWQATIIFLVAMGILKLFGGYALFYTLMAVFALAVPYLLNRQLTSTREVWKMTFMGIVFCFSLFIIGYSVYPTVMVRAAKKPAINEGNPDTWERYKAYMEREQYGQENMYLGMFTRKANFDYQFNFMYVRYLLKQFPKWGPTLSLTFENEGAVDNQLAETQPVRDEVALSVLLFALVLYGFYLHGSTDWRRFVPLLLFFTASSIGLVLYLNLENPQVRERPYFFLGSFYIIFYWLGFGIYGVTIDILDWLREKGWARLAAPAAVVLSLTFLTMVPAAVLSNHIDPGFTQYETHDRSRDWAPKDYGYNILVSCLQDAILFTNGDNDTFPLWYLQEVEDFRKDVRVVNLSLLNTDWYILQMKHEGDPVPSPEEFEAMLAEPGQYPIDLAAVDTLDVRTTNTQKVLSIQYDDDFIENVLCGIDETSLRHRLWPVEGKTVSAAGIEWLLPTTYLLGDEYGMIRVQDVVVYDIIRWNNWMRPLYFAVTVARENMIGLDDHLAMEGMAFRLMPQKAPEGMELVNIEELDRNVFDRYQYHTLSDPTVYKPPNTLKLGSNYFVGLAQLTERYLALNDPENAVRAAWGSITLTPADLGNRQLIYQIFSTRNYIEELRPFIDREFSRPGILNGTEGLVADRLYLCHLLKQLGEGERTAEYIQTEEARIDSRSFEARYSFAVELARTNLYEESYSYLTELSHDYPQNQETLELMLALAHALGKYEEALAAADRLVELDPTSKEFRDNRDLLMSLVNPESAGDSLSPPP